MFNVGDKVRLTAKGVDYVEMYICREDEERWNSGMEGVIESIGVVVNVRLPIRFEHDELLENPDVWPFVSGDIALIRS